MEVEEKRGEDHHHNNNHRCRRRRRHLRFRNHPSTTHLTTTSSLALYALTISHKQIKEVKQATWTDYKRRVHVATHLANDDWGWWKLNHVLLVLLYNIYTCINHFNNADSIASNSSLSLINKTPAGQFTERRRFAVVVDEHFDDLARAVSHSLARSLICSLTSLGVSIIIIIIIT